MSTKDKAKDTQYSPKVTKLLDEVLSLTLKEGLEFSDILQERYNISMGGATGVAAAPQPSAETKEEGADEAGKEFTLSVIGIEDPSKKQKLILCFKKLLGIGVGEAVKLHAGLEKEQTPVLIQEAVADKAKLDELGKEIALAGGKVKISVCE